MENYLPLTLFALSMCATPGPNNMMLTASGANFGFNRTIPHIQGIEVGLVGMFILSGFGLGLLFQALPTVQKLLKVASIFYLFYLSWKIATSAPKSAESGTVGKPLNLMQAALFQMVNPKVMVMAISAMSTFSISGEEYSASVIRIVVVFGLVCIPAISVWAGFGTLIGSFLKGAKSLRTFNILMGSLTASSVYMML